MSANERILAAVIILVGRGYMLSMRKYHAMIPDDGCSDAVEVANPRKQPEDNAAL